MRVLRFECGLCRGQFRTDKAFDRHKCVPSPPVSRVEFGGMIVELHSTKKRP